MSLCKIGANDVSEETQRFKDKLASRDGHIASQQTQIMRQAEELEEIKKSLNEALHKLASESERALRLEKDLIQCKDDLKNEKISSHNVQISLELTTNKLKDKDNELKDLEAHLDRLSQVNDYHKTQCSKHEREKATLEARNRELESTLQQMHSSVPSRSHRRASSRASSQFQDLKIITLEKELLKIQEQLSARDQELQNVREKLSYTQQELLRSDNEKIAREAKANHELERLTSLLQEREEELEFHRSQQGDGGREEELLRRIEEDEAKILALESMLKQSGDSKKLKRNIGILEERLKDEKRKVSVLESQVAEADREREHALNDLQVVQTELDVLRSQLDTRSPEPSVNEETAADVAKLLDAITRIREDRDNLRRSLQFLEAEHRFAVEALEKQLAAASEALSSTSSDHKAEMEPEFRRISLAAAACAALVAHSQDRCEEYQQLLSESLIREEDAIDRAQSEAQKRSDLEDDMEQLTNQLGDCNSRLQEANNLVKTMADQRDDLLEQLEAKQTSRRELQDQLQEAEARYGEMCRILEDTTSERDSLSLQVTNLLADVQAKEDQLTDAETRYSALQFRQLSTMTGSEATTALRKQIEELEGKVVRRTEQIGIHQHDIKRLETNLALQEERLAEMTLELETLAAQKNAMVEDCADAREARDEALHRVETLEDELETLESKLAESDNALNALTCVFVQTLSQLKSAVHDVVQLELELERQKKIQEDEVDQLRDSNSEDVRQLTVALAVVQTDFRGALEHIRDLMRFREQLADDISATNKRLQEQEDANRALSEECLTLRQGSTSSLADLASRTSQYQAEIDVLKRTISETQAQKDSVEQQLVSSAADLEQIREEREHLLTEKQSIELDLREYQQSCGQKIQDLQNEVMEISTLLEQERVARTDLECDRSESLSKAQATITEMEQESITLKEQLAALHSTQQVLMKNKENGDRELEGLRAELQNLLEERVLASQTQHELEDANRRLSEEIYEMRERHDAMVVVTQSQMNERQQELETQNQNLLSKIDDLQRSMAETAEEIKSLSQELEVERQKLRDSEDRHVMEMQEVSRDRDDARAGLSSMQEQVANLEDTIRQNEIALAEHEQQKTQLQESMIALEAKIQKSISYTLSLERQINDGVRASEVLKERLSQSETSAKTAEMNLSLQSAQFKREISRLQKKVAALESRPDLEEALANLEERNNEMEELLKAKCAEIEENDDRALEMLKENKKLSNKVEALTRKVQNLQTKLAAAKATKLPRSPPEVEESPAVSSAKPEPVAKPEFIAKPEPRAKLEPTAKPEPIAKLEPRAKLEPIAKPEPNPRRRSSRQSNGTSESLPAHDLPSSRTSKQHTARTVSGSTRPRTPEKRLPAGPVFKLRTPEQSRTQGRTTEPPPSVVGVKRRAPDDFEQCESMPPQGFTVESVPSRGSESTTPRVRRMISNLQSGFTPIRHKLLTSPKRQSVATSAAVIQDVTNSPRNNGYPDHGLSSKESKRSWLGKIRGTTSQVPTKPARGPVFTSVGQSQS